MQQKHKYSRVVILAMIVLGMTVAVFGVLLAKNLPAPQQEIIRDLDVSTFATD